MEMIWNSACVAWDWVMEHLLYINLIFSIIIVFFQRRDPRTSTNEDTRRQVPLFHHI